jgi:hypothetical protein
MSSYSTTQKPSQRQFADPLSRMEEEQEGYLARGQAQLRQMTAEREGRTVLIALAAGFGVGLLLGGALINSGRRFPWSQQAEAETLGRRILDRMDQYLPDAITRHVHR